MNSEDFLDLGEKLTLMSRLQCRNKEWDNSQASHFDPRVDKMLVGFSSSIDTNMFKV